MSPTKRLVLWATCTCCLTTDAEFNTQELSTRMAFLDSLCSIREAVCGCLFFSNFLPTKQYIVCPLPYMHHWNSHIEALTIAFRLRLSSFRINLCWVWLSGGCAQCSAQAHPVRCRGSRQFCPFTLVLVRFRGWVKILPTRQRPAGLQALCEHATMCMWDIGLTAQCKHTAGMQLAT